MELAQFGTSKYTFYAINLNMFSMANTFKYREHRIQDLEDICQETLRANVYFFSTYMYMSDGDTKYYNKNKNQRKKESNPIFIMVVVDQFEERKKQLLNTPSPTL